MEGWLMTGSMQGSCELSHFHPQAAGQRTNTGSLPSTGPRGPTVCLGRKRTWSDGLRILAPGSLTCTVSPPSCGLLQIPSPGAAAQRPGLAFTAHEDFRWDDAQSGVFVHRVWAELPLVTGAGLLHPPPLPCWGRRGPRCPAFPELSTQTSKPSTFQKRKLRRREGTFPCRLTSSLRSWSLCDLSPDLTFLCITMAQPGLQGARGSF